MCKNTWLLNINFFWIVIGLELSTPGLGLQRLGHTLFSYNILVLYLISLYFIRLYLTHHFTFRCNQISFSPKDQFTSWRHQSQSIFGIINTNYL